MKYAYTIMIHRHTPMFCGPFNTYDQMIESIIDWVKDDEFNIGDTIADNLIEDPEYTLERLDIEVFEINDNWKLNNKEIDKVSEKMIEILVKRDKYQAERLKEKEEIERKQYEKLKEKYEAKE